MTTTIHRIQANEALFALAAAAIEAHSRRTGRFESVHTACAEGSRILALAPPSPDALTTAADQIAQAGELGFCLRIDRRWSEDWKHARERIETALGRPASVRECAAVILQVVADST